MALWSLLEKTNFFILRWLENHGLEQGFAFTITHSNKDRQDGLPRRRIYTCTRGQKYVPRKEAHTKESRNTGHNTDGCKFHVNAYRRKTDNLVHINKVKNQHNHELVDNIAALASCYRKLTPAMCDDIRLLAACGVHAGAIIEVLQHKNLGKYIHARNVYNIVQSICHQNHVKSDTSSMYLELMKQQQENPAFHVDAQFEGQDNHLVELC